MNIIILVSCLLIGFVQCDLIGYNRLGNNVHSHNRFRNNMNTVPQYKQQISNWLLENDAPSFNGWPKMRTKNTRQTRNNRRRNLYTRRMIQNV